MLDEKDKKEKIENKAESSEKEDKKESLINNHKNKDSHKILFQMKWE